MSQKKYTTTTFSKALLVGVWFCSVLLAWCGKPAETSISIDNISFSIPKEYQLISSSSLDSAQIVHNIVAARKASDSNIILASSTLPAQTSLKTFAEKSRTRISQEMIGYVPGSLSSKNFTCNGKKNTGYLHTFTKADLKDSTKTLVYYTQYYFLQEGSLYILSIAQDSQKSIVNNIISSLACWTTTSK